MRYYEFAINGVAEKIKGLLQDKECLREYRWLNAICAVNSYMYHNLKNNVGFLAYRQETDDKILAVLFLDEKRETLENVYDYIISNLHCRRGTMILKKLLKDYHNGRYTILPEWE